jgi:uracil-DNA glycosylase family 4
VSTFFIQGQREKAIDADGYSIEFLHQQECKVCPLNGLHAQLCHPKMPATGAKEPLIYMLGEAPGENEDKHGVPFVGRAGQVLRFRIPDDWNNVLRWSNVIRCRPPDNRDPTKVEIECCRPYHVRDIETTMPVAIFGFGNVPLMWALGQTGITRWCGRRIPIKIGDHSCWFFPMVHPSYVMRTRKFEPRTTDQYGSQVEFAFALDLQRAFDAIETLPKPIVHTRDMALKDCTWVTGAADTDIGRVMSFLRDAGECAVVGFDYETNVTRPYTDDAKILTVAIATDHEAFAFPLFHKQAKWNDEERDAIMHGLRRFLYRGRCRKIAHHLAFEMEWSAYFFGDKCLHESKWGDTLTQAYTLDERQNMLSLDILCLQYFGLNLKAIANVDPARLDDTDIELVLQYNALDAKYHRLLYIEQKQRLQDEGLMEVYHDLLRRIPPMVLTQKRGVPVDQEEAQRLHDRYERRLEKIEDKLHALSVCQQFETVKGHKYRPSALHDTRYVLNKILHIFPDKLNEAALAEIDHPIAKWTLRWRKANKLMGTYVKPMMEGSPQLYSDGLLHQTLTTTKTKTTRTSSNEPNLQNVPKRGPGKEVRKAIKAPGRKVVAFDYSGIQARNIAMESKDKALVKAFWERYDVHGDWAERIVSLYPQWVNGGAKAFADKDVRKKYRDIAKNKFVFPAFFGAQAKTLAGYLKIPDHIANKLFDKLWDMFPGIRDWHAACKNFYNEHGYVTGLSGVRRRAPISPNQLINAPIQADEALIVCSAMASLVELEDPRFHPMLEIHDDLTFLWPTHEIDKNIETVVTEMLRIQFDWINVPLAVEVSAGDDWESLKEIGKFSSDKL